MTSSTNETENDKVMTSQQKISVSDEEIELWFTQMEQKESEVITNVTSEGPTSALTDLQHITEPKDGAKNGSMHVAFTVEENEPLHERSTARSSERTSHSSEHEKASDEVSLSLTDYEDDLEDDIENAERSNSNFRPQCSTSSSQFWAGAGVPGDFEDFEDEDNGFPTRRARSISDAEIVVSEEILAKELLDREYKRENDMKKIEWTARIKCLRQSATVTFFIFALYIFIGVLFYSVWQTDWTVADALLFIVYTVTTVGYGNYSVPDDHLNRIFTTLYLLVGMFLLSVTISEMFQWLALEAARAQFARDKDDIAKQGMALAAKLPVRGLQRSESVKRISAAAQKSHTSHTARVMQWISDPIFSMFRKTKFFFSETYMGQHLSLFLPHSLLVIVLAAVVGPIEGWDVIASMYFAVVSISTVGYGDLYPTKKASIWFCSFYLPLAMLWLPLFFTNASTLYLTLHKKNIERIRRNLRGNDDSTPQPNEVKAKVLDKSMSMKDLLQSLKRAHGKNDDDSDYSFGDERDGKEPSFALRALVIKRMALIIINEIVGRNYDVLIKGSSLTVTFSTLKETATKWMIPRRAREAFRQVAFEVIMYVGSRSLMQEGSDHLFSLSSAEIHKMFLPLIAAMGSSNTMETWLASTDLLAIKAKLSGSNFL